MAYKSAVLRASLYDYKEASYSFGFNLDKWLRQELINLGVIPSNADCCTTKSLFLKGGFVFRGTEGGFNFNQYLYQILGRLGITLNGYCCPAKDIHIDQSYVFYQDNNLTGLKLINWIKARLDFYNISYTDPCCQ